jgi:phosphate-selective porin OprO and OprP
MSYSADSDLEPENKPVSSHGEAAMTHRFKLTAMAMAIAALSASPAYAEVVETKGGLKVASDDGRFSFQLGGRVHFDTYIFDEDTVSTTSTTEFRRTRLTLTGKLYDWAYKIEQDFSAGNTTAGYRDVFLSTRALGGTVMFGQFKPFRAMEEMTSSNEITMMERPFATATGIYSGRQFQQGIGYRINDDNWTAGVSLFNLRDAAGPRNEGIGAAGRATFAPVRTDNGTVHLGLSVSHENANRNSAAGSASASYAGRRGPAQTIATQGDGASVDTVGLEFGMTRGPFFVQAEYAMATFGQAAGAPDQDVNTYYLMGSWMLTGETKPYHASNGVFRSVKPKGESGAWELTARYDYIENKDVTDLSATSIAVGVNYYVNPAIRFMMNYTMGENDVNGDETGQLALRGQLAF